MEGEVANLADYGAFLNIGAITAMLHRSELSWEKKNPVPREFLSIGDKVKVNGRCGTEENLSYKSFFHNLCLATW